MTILYEKYMIKIKKESGVDYLSIIRGGYQWSSVPIKTIEEARAIYRELISFYGVEILEGVETIPPLEELE